MFGPFMNVFFVPLLKVDCVVITDLLDERVLVGGAFRNMFHSWCVLCVLKLCLTVYTSTHIICNLYKHDGMENVDIKEQWL
jgi:hypothetical protein